MLSLKNFNFLDNHVKCKQVFRDWIWGIIKSILQIPLNTPQRSIKTDPIFIPCSEVIDLPLNDLRSSQEVSMIPCCDLNRPIETLSWLVNPHKESIPILAMGDFTKCERNVNIFSQMQNRKEYVVNTNSLLGDKHQNIRVHFGYIYPVGAEQLGNCQFKTGLMEGKKVNKSDQPICDRCRMINFKTRRQHTTTNG